MNSALPRFLSLKYNSVQYGRRMDYCASKSYSINGFYRSDTAARVLDPGPGACGVALRSSTSTEARGHLGTFMDRLGWPNLLIPYQAPRMGKMAGLPCYNMIEIQEIFDFLPLRGSLVSHFGWVLYCAPNLATN